MQKQGPDIDITLSKFSVVTESVFALIRWFEEFKKKLTIKRRKEVSLGNSITNQTSNHRGFFDSA